MNPHNKHKQEPKAEEKPEVKQEEKAEAKPKETQYKEVELKDLRKAQAEISARIGPQPTGKRR